MIPAHSTDVTVAGTADPAAVAVDRYDVSGFGGVQVPPPTRQALAVYGPQRISPTLRVRENDVE